MWKIAEIEDTNENEFTVSVLPKTWTFIIRGQLFCYWPNNNPGPKIKSCEKPDKWKLDSYRIYKCRLLMKGGKRYQIYALEKLLSEPE